MNWVKRVTGAIWARCFPNRWKQGQELDYWRRRRAEEKEFAHGHYQNFFTGHFGLACEDYAGKRILDLGCGPRGSLEWARDAQERIGLDPLADRFQTLGADRHRMKYVAAPSEAIPFPAAYFDFVSSFNSLDHVDDLAATIREIKRVLKPGGFFLLLTEVNHDRTACEPQEFSWEIVEKFRPEFEPLEEKHYEAKADGMYYSILAAAPYDHQNPSRRLGYLSVKFRKGDGARV